MKLIPLYRRGVLTGHAKMDDADYELLSRFNWHLNRGYAKNFHMGFMHRVVNGTPEGSVTDHINGDPLDNRRVNLRSCTHGTNLRKQRLRSDNTSGFTGVGQTKNPAYRYRTWCAYINIDGRRKELGWFATREEAADARRLALVAADPVLALR